MLFGSYVKEFDWEHILDYVEVRKKQLYYYISNASSSIQGK